MARGWGVNSAQLAFGGKYSIIQDKRLRETSYGDLAGKEDYFKNDLEKYISQSFPRGERYIDVE